MPHRDPQTGQFVSDDHAGAVADADKMLFLKTEPVIGDENNTPVAEYDSNNTPVTLDTITVQRDLRVLGLEYAMWSATENMPSGTDPDGSIPNISAQVQFGTTGSFQAPGAPENGAEVPAGLYYHEDLDWQSGQVWEDETNGTGGTIQATNHVFPHRAFVPAEQIVDADVTLDQGTSLSQHLEVTRAGASSTAEILNVATRIYAAERED